MTVYQSVKRAYEFSYAHTRDKSTMVPMKEPRHHWDWTDVPMGEKPRKVIDGWRKVPNTWITRHDDGSYSVTFYSTHILHVTRSGRVTLNTGGWETVTTKGRLSRFLRAAGYVVGSERRVWKVLRVPYWDPVAVFEGNVRCTFMDRQRRAAGVTS